MWELWFLLKETETQTDQESLNVAQMKARRIIESFENPFRMVRDDQLLTLSILFSWTHNIQPSLWFQYLPSSDVHVNKNAKFDPSSKIFEVIQELHTFMYIQTYLCSPLNYVWMFTNWQISKRWKLQSIEQQQKELEAKRKAKEEAKEHKKKVAGNVGTNVL